MKNRRKNSWLVILLMIVGLVVPLEVRAANVAKVSIDSSCENMEIAYGDQVSLDLLIEGAKERIRYSVNIYEGNSTKEADKLGGKTNELLCNQEKFWLELSFQSSDPLWSFTVGNVYTVEYRIQYWNGSGWEETKAATTSFKIIPNICKSKHSYQTPVSVYTEATCTEEGFGAYQCTMCGGRNKAVIPAKGHDYKEGVITRKPSCKQEGVRTFACKNCGAIKTETIAMLPHEYNEGIVIEHPTVNVPGLKDCICQVCDKAAEVEIPPIFSDVFTDWYTEAIQYVYDAGVMTGIKGTDLFGTFETVTKAQVAQVFYNMEENPEHSGKVFEELSDVADYEWYADAVGWAYDTGVVTGDTNTKEFSPNSEVTREQLSLMMYRYAGYKGYDTTERDDLRNLLNEENTSNWAREGVEWAVGAGLISGVDKNGAKDLQPQGRATRAQMAAILQRFCQWTEHGQEPEVTPEVRISPKNII